MTDRTAVGEMDGLPSRRRPMPNQSAPPRGDEVNWSNSDATRYLCVGAYLDPEFRKQVLNEVLFQGYRAVAPSYGIDIVPVIRHCLEARRREITRNWVLLGVFAVAIVLGRTSAVSAGCLLIGLRLFVNAVKGLRRARIIPVLWFFLIGSPLLLLAVTLSFPKDSATAFLDDPTYTDSGTAWGAFGRTLASLLLLVALIGVAWVARFVELHANHRTILEELSPGRFDPGQAPTESSAYRARIALLAEAQHGNVTYYSRKIAELPFVGSGRTKKTWRIATPLHPVEERGTDPGNLTTEALYEAIRRALIPLNSVNLPPQQRIVGLSIKPRLFVPGLLRSQDGLLDRASGAPRHRMPREQMQQFGQNDRNKAVSYLTVRIGAWGGELEVTCFLFCSIRGSTLYLEFFGTELPSTKELYHAADSYQRLDARVMTGLALEALASLPRMLLYAPVEHLRRFRDKVRSNFSLRGQMVDINSRLAYDFGATTSVRELGAGWEDYQLFQDLDADRYFLLVERRVRDSVAVVLNELGYSIEEFMEVTQNIINNNVTLNTNNNSGTFTSQGSMQFGADSQINQIDLGRSGTPAATGPGGRTP
jgi:hypothetical protein